MSKTKTNRDVVITVFRQARVDGGRRTGVDINGTTYLQQFRRGRQAHNPALVWFIDVTFSGPRLPDEPNEARSWLVEHRDNINQALKEMAKTLGPVDPDAIPFEDERSVRGLTGVKMRIAVSAMRRTDARQVQDELRAFADDWESAMNGLTDVASVDPYE
jgi:hypothetical protein